MVQPVLGANAGIDELAQLGNTLYLAGGFSLIGPTCGGGVPLDRTIGVPVQSYAKVAGVLYASVSDGAGGWFIGGDFSAVGGQERGNLAHILPDGSVAPWRADADGVVRSLALAEEILYVGGDFTHLAGAERSHLAAVTADQGKLSDWEPGVAGKESDYSTVRAILPKGPRVYIGGDFTAVGGLSRRCLAAVDTHTGRVLEFAPEATGGVVKAMVQADSTLYVGGSFYGLGGQSMRLFGAVDAVTGSMRAWESPVSSMEYDFDVAPCVSALAVEGDHLYLAGHFTRVGGQVRGGIASVELATGTVSDWNPNPIVERSLVRAPVIDAMVVDGDVAYVGGYTAVGPQQRRNLAAIDLTTGVLTAFDARVIGSVLTLCANGRSVYAGGYIHTLWNWQYRNRLAAIDMVSGELLPWNPDPGGGSIMSIAANEHAVYVGGRFSQINGESRDNVAALDPVTGSLEPWNPGADGAVSVIATSGDRVYIGGDFWNVAGLTRRYLAGVEGVTGDVEPWNPSATSVVLSIVPSDSSVFVGGGFSFIGGQARNSLAEVDTSLGLARPWDPDVDGDVEAIAVLGRTVYAGGEFWHVGGAPRVGIAAVDRTTGAVTGWNPVLGGAPPYFSTPIVATLLLADGVLYAGGSFGSLDGAEQLNAAAFDAASGKALVWKPEPNSSGVTSLLAHGGSIYMAGGFSRVGTSPAEGLGAWAAAAGPASVPSHLALGSCYPNPSSSVTSISFALPAPALVTLSIFDLQGRRVAMPLREEQRSAGPQSAEVHVAGWPIGCYFYRLEAGGSSATRKMLVVK